MSMRRLSQVVVALSLVTSASRLDAASATERDAGFAAVQALIAAEVRAPAERQQAEFLAAGYGGLDWYRRFLAWDFADHFHSADPTQVEAMRRELAEAIAHDPGVPDAVKAAFASSSAGSYLRLINELGRAIDPDGAPTLAGRDSIPTEERARRDLLVRTLVAAAGSAWTQASAVAATCEQDSARDLDLPSGDPRYVAASAQLALRRFDALRTLHQAHIVLREVITRGPAFGIDPVPAAQFMRDTLAAGMERIARWDFESGDEFLPLKAYANTLLGEAVRQRLPGLGAEAVESELMTVIAADLRAYPASVRDQLVELQLSTCGALMRWRLELGDPASLKRGVEAWQFLQGRLKAMPVKLADADAKARALAQDGILAARLAFALKDGAGATAALGDVLSSRTNPLIADARTWMQPFRGIVCFGLGDWVSAPVAADPGEGLAVAKAFIAQAGQTIAAPDVRALYLRAAVELRNAVLGVAAAGAEVSPATCAEVYRLYAQALTKLDLRFHAAIAAQEGLRALAARERERVPSEETRRLARAALLYAATLSSRSQGAAVRKLYGDTIELAKQVSPDDASGRDGVEIALAMDAGDFAQAIALAEAYGAAHVEGSDERCWAFGLACTARLRAIEALRRRLVAEPGLEREFGRISDELVVRCAAQRALLRRKSEAHQQLTAAESRADAAALTASVAVLLDRGRYAEVIAALGADAWAEGGPSDEAAAAHLLRTLCAAVQRQQSAALADPAAARDPQAVVAAFASLAAIHHDIYARQIERLHDGGALTSAREGGRMLAMAFKAVADGGERLLAAHAAGADALRPIVLESKRALADLLVPTLDEHAEPRLLLATGDLLWELEDRARGSRLYAWYLGAVAADAQVQAFRRDRAATLDGIEAVVATRPELKPIWARLRTLLEDSVDAARARRDGRPRAEWGPDQTPVDFPAAAAELETLRTAVAGARTLIGAEGYQRMGAALDRLSALVRTLVQELRVTRALASWYRDSGRSAEARPLYQALIDYDPEDPDAAAGMVENLIADLRVGRPVTAAELERARTMSISRRGAPGFADPFAFWSAQLQIFELSVALHDLDPISRTLRLLRASGDISHDLIQPPVRADGLIVGDDVRVRRAKDGRAVQLARHFLTFYDVPGVVVTRGFRIQEVAVAGTTWTLFVDADAPAMAGTEVRNAEGDPVVVFLPVGMPALKATPTP